MELNCISVKNLTKMTTAALIILSGNLLLSCNHNSPADVKKPADQAPTRPTEIISKLKKTIEDSDSKGFAAICIYPIARPYPLRDIGDSIDMEAYFPVMIDDSLRKAVGESKGEDWESYGWRGWSFGASTPLWVDDSGLEIVSYVSNAEKGLQKILAREELLTLAPEFREGWTPVMTMLSENGEQLYRIDTKDGKMRLMGFDMPYKKGATPTVLMLGSVSTEGTAQYEIYDFASPDGRKAEYSPDGEPPVKIQFISPTKGETDVEVCPAYWRDIVK